MMRKQPRSQFINLVKKGAAAVFIAEVGAFGVCYYIYHHMNTDRDFRYYMKNNYSFALESFYTLGEYMNKTDQTRKIDNIIWSKQFPVISERPDDLSGRK